MSNINNKSKNTSSKRERGWSYAGRVSWGSGIEMAAGRVSWGS